MLVAAVAAVTGRETQQLVERSLHLMHLVHMVLA
jgi:hypothetical protein